MNDIQGKDNYIELPSIRSLDIDSDKEKDIVAGSTALTARTRDWLEKRNIAPEVKEDLLWALAEDKDHPFYAINSYDYDKVTVNNPALKDRII